MSKPEQSQPPLTRCWQPAREPPRSLLGRLAAGPLRLPDGQMTEAVAQYIRMLRREQVTKPAILVGCGTCGLGAGAGKTLQAVHAYVAGRDIDADVVEVGCVGLCSFEPLVDVQLPGRTRLCYGSVTPETVPTLLSDVFSNKLSEGLLGQYRPMGGMKTWDAAGFLDEHPFFNIQRRLVLAFSGIVDPSSIDEYIANGGYSAIDGLLYGATPEEVCDAFEKSGLRGRGGGGFVAGKKWKLARANVADQKYLICNADEGDPGAFMDRAVVESDPHRLLEGMMIAAYGVGASKAYICIRAEYPLAIKRLQAAIEQAKKYGLLGKNILGSGFDLEIKIKTGAGAFVCGEETALIASIEGKRGMPRPRPPYPAQSGLFGKPTVIHNVETLANLPSIVQMGWQGFAAMGTEGSKGTKVFALSGMVERTGLVEVPMGATIRQVVFDVGGGIPNGKKCKAVQIGGPSGGCIPEPHFNVPCDYEALEEFGAIMGSGSLVVLDESTCMVDLAKFFMEFIQSESCGKCIPCREGTRRMLEILEALTRARPHETENDALLRFQGIISLKRLGDVIRSTSLCGLGQTAPNPVLSTLRWFRDEYEAHLLERRCPAGACSELAGAPCQTACSAGTEVWRYADHVGRQENSDTYRVLRSVNPFPSAFSIEINGKAIRATNGETILTALRRENIKVPTLCHIADLAPTGACRMCVVEVEGFGGLVPSCSHPVAAGMKIRTNSPRVLDARRTIVELLLSNHPDDCLYCGRNGCCDLQSLARELGVRERLFRGKRDFKEMDVSSPSIERDPGKCILCGKCVRVCEEIQGVSAIDFIGRGSNAFVGTAFNRGLNVSSCIHCGQCVMICPTGALREKSVVREVLAALADPQAFVVTQHAPAVSVSIAEEFGVDPGKDVDGHMVAALRRLGFKRVFDTSFAADLTVMEEGSELVSRIQNKGVLPMMTSCSPGWIKFVEQTYPEFLPNISTCKSPQQMMGAIIKSFFAEREKIDSKKIVSVSIMPCTAKKFEAQREEMGRDFIPDVDYVLTIRELAEIIRLHGIDITALAPENADTPFGRRSSAGKLFGGTGGVMEAAIRSTHFLMTGQELKELKIQELRGLKGSKEVHLKIGDFELGAAVVSGMGNARKLLEEIKSGGRRDIQFIEVMTCPGGCVNGGGQPFRQDPETVKSRIKALYRIDRDDSTRVSHANPAVQKLYREFLGKPLGKRSHDLLHTHYHKRDVGG